MHGNGLLLRGLRGPRIPWRREVLVPNRLRRSVLRGRQWSLLPSHPYSTRARTAQRAQGDDAGSSGGLDSQAQAPALLRLTTGDAPSPPSPPGLFGTSAGAHSPPPSPPVAHQRRHTAPPPIVSPITAFLLHARRQAADGAVDPAPGSPAPAGVPLLPPLANSAEDDGAPGGVSQLPPPANPVMDDDAVAAPPVAATRKRKGRGSSNNTAQNERKRQRHAAFLLATQGDTEAGT